MRYITPCPDLIKKDSKFAQLVTMAILKNPDKDTIEVDYKGKKHKFTCV